MSYLLAQILVCLLIAGLIGAVIGWLLRGGCKNRLKECEDEWKLKMGALESEYNSKLNIGSREKQENDINLEQARLKSQSVKSSSVDSKSNLSKESEETKRVGRGQDIKERLLKKGVFLDDKKIATYALYGVDFENDKNLEDNYDIETIEGIGPKYASIFKTLGISTTQDLVNRLKGKEEDTEKFAQELRVQPEVIKSWVSMAELISLPGVDAQAAELMQTVGITSLSHLSQTDANSLHQTMKNFNEKTPIVPEVPSNRWVEIWTKISKAFS